MENIQLIGMEDFDELEKAEIRSITETQYVKIKRDLKDLNLVIHVKKKAKDGSRQRFSTIGKAEADGALVANATSSDWKLEKALHMVLNKLDNGIQHKFKTKGKRV